LETARSTGAFEPVPTLLLDAAFDLGFITVADDGQVIVSPVLSTENRALLEFDRPLRVKGLADAHRVYLPWHRENLFRSTGSV